MGLIKRLFFREKGVKDTYRTSDISNVNKQDIITMREDGLKPSEIALELNISAEKVCKVLEHERRRLALVRNTITSEDMTNRLKQKELELKELELTWKIEDAKARREEELNQDIEPEQDDDINSMLKVMLASFLSNKPGINPNSLDKVQDGATANNIHSAVALPELTEAQIQAILSEYPAEVKQLRKLPDAEIQPILASRIPGYGQATYELATAIIKGR